MCYPFRYPSWVDQVSPMWLIIRKILIKLVPRVGFEPTAYRLRSGCSTAELSGPRGQVKRSFLARKHSAAKPVYFVKPSSTNAPQFPPWGSTGPRVPKQVSEIRTDSPQTTTKSKRSRPSRLLLRCAARASHRHLRAPGRARHAANRTSSEATESREDRVGHRLTAKL
jgi:hypothetical protein